jgi:hypothetical protein
MTSNMSPSNKSGCEGTDRLTAMAPETFSEESKVRRENAPTEKKAPENGQSSVDDEEDRMRVRALYQQALRAGMNIAEASAYANNRNSPPECGQDNLSAGRSTVLDCQTAHSGSGDRIEAIAAPLSPEPTSSASEDAGHHQKNG